MNSSPFVLLDDNLSPDGSSFFFEGPEELVICDHPDQLEASLDKIQKGLWQGFHAAGFFAYELGYLLEPKLAHLFHHAERQPLIWVGLFNKRERLSEKQVFEYIGKLAEKDGDLGSIENLRLSMNKEDYLSAFRKAQEYISAGDVYQINLTLKYLFEFHGNPFALYQELRRKQKVAYGGMIASDAFTTLSLSPELFFKIQDDQISARPMKGTAPRGLTPDDDKKIADWLHNDEKSRAENLMIVDLLRNDLGRIAKIGSVKVTDLYTVENYRTVLQMTSGITAKLERDLNLVELLHAIFPCGSVTGAPKVRAMEIIRELENAPRGVYTGAIGMLSPDRQTAFNVAIRTLLLHKDGHGEMGIGSGVVADSKAEAEFDECLLKAHFLTEPYPEFQLIETLRHEQDKGYYLLDRHLARLERSANHFGYRFNKDETLKALSDEASRLEGPVHMVRLLLDERGGLTTSHYPITLPEPGDVWQFALSDKPIDQDNIIFYHKTTRREFYTEEFDRYHKKYGIHDVVFLNGRGELSEGSRTNIFIKKGNELFTPPVSNGLLPGTLREELLSSPRSYVVEKTLTIEDLLDADEIYLGNSVRGLVRSEWVNRPNS